MMIKSYEEMSVGVYCAIMATLNEEGASEADKMLGLVSALTGKTADELLDEPLEEWRAQNEAAAFVREFPAPHKVQESYTLRGVRYLPTLLERKMTAGQFIDFNEYAKREDAENLWAEVLSVILVPEGKTYGRGYDIGDVQDAIREGLCILDAVALRAFFLTLCGRYAQNTQHSLEIAMRRTGTDRKERRKILRTMRVQVRALLASGVGWRALMRWLKLPEAAGILQPQDPSASS